MDSGEERGAQFVAEATEYSELSPKAQRYIARSLEVAQTGLKCAKQWARGVGESSSIMVQVSLYMRLPEARNKIPKSNAFWELSDFFGYALPCAAFDVSEGRLDGFAAFKFLYERLLGARARPWLASLYAAAVALPNFRPSDFYTTDGGWNCEIDSRDWDTTEPQFMPEWVPDRHSE